MFMLCSHPKGKKGGCLWSSAPQTPPKYLALREYIVEKGSYAIAQKSNHIQGKRMKPVFEGAFPQNDEFAISHPSVGANRLDAFTLEP